jgi:hypothetical protein
MRFVLSRRTDQSLQGVAGRFSKRVQSQVAALLMLTPDDGVL